MIVLGSHETPLEFFCTYRVEESIKDCWVLVFCSRWDYFFFFSGNTELLFFLNVKIYLVFIETIKGILPLNYICVQWKLPSDGWNSFFDSMPCARSLSSMPVQQSYSMFPYSIFECLLMQFLCICYVFNALMFI